jgi:hypothetical protein
MAQGHCQFQWLKAIVNFNVFIWWLGVGVRSFFINDGGFILSFNVFISGWGLELGLSSLRERLHDMYML